MTARMSTAIFIALCLFALTAPAEWQRTVSVLDTRTPAQGKVQAELFGGYVEGTDGDFTETSAWLDLRYGIMDNWYVAVSPGFLSIDIEGSDSETGIGDTDVLTLYRFLDESKDALDLAVAGIVRLPTGDEDKNLGQGNVEPTLALSAAKTLGPVVAVANAGYTAILDGHEGEEDGVFSARLEGVVPLTEQASLNVFARTATARWEGTDEDVYAGVGGVFRPQENLRLSASYTAGLTDDAFDWMADVAAGYEF